MPGCAVDLDDDPINLIRQRFALGLPALSKFRDLVQIFRQLAIRIHLESRQLQGIHGFRLTVEKSLSIFQQHVGEEIHAALRRNGRFELPHRPRRKVARIRKRRQSLPFALFIQLAESGERHQHFAAHFEICGDTGLLQLVLRNRERDRAHRPHIQGHVFADVAIAARDAAFQTPVAVDERQGHAIELQFAHVLEGGLPAQFVHAALPVAQFVFTVSVVERKHRRRVLRLDESLARLAAHALGRRVWRDVLRMLGLKPLKLVHQRVEADVRNLRIVEHVIAILMVPNLLAQGFDLLLDLLVGVGTRHDWGIIVRRQYPVPSCQYPVNAKRRGN